MAPMIPRYDDLGDGRIEEILRERAFADGADLWVGRVEDGRWRAAYRIYVSAEVGDRKPADLGAARGPTRRAALIALAQIDDIGTIN